MGIDPLTNISLRILDADSGVDFSSIRILVIVGAVVLVAFDGGSWGPNFGGGASFYSPIVVAGQHGFDFILDPTGPLPVGLTTVVVQARDAACNALEASFSFTSECIPEGCTVLSPLPPSVPAGWGGGPWGGGPWGGASGGGLVPLVGAGTPVVVSVEPPTGVTLGGTPFVLIGTDLATFNFNDHFSDGFVSAALWSKLGPALATTEGPIGPAGKLHVVLPASPGLGGGVEAKALRLRADFHIEVTVTILTPYLNPKPAGEVVLACIEAKLDDGNLLRLSLIMPGPTAPSAIMKAEVWKFGNLMHVFSEDRNLSTFTFGVSRFFDPVFNDNKAAFYVNGSLFAEFFDAPACTLVPRLYTWNKSSPTSLQVDYDNFLSHSVVVFVGPNGAAEALAPLEITPERIRGLTPPTLGQWAGLVYLRVSNGSGNGCVAITDTLFTYFYPEAFVVGRNVPYRPVAREASLITDPVLRNLGPNIGTGLRRPDGS